MELIEVANKSLQSSLKLICKFCKAERHFMGAQRGEAIKDAIKDGWRRDGLAFVCRLHPAPLKRCGWCDELVADGHVCPDMK